MLPYINSVCGEYACPGNFLAGNRCRPDFAAGTRKFQTFSVCQKTSDINN